MKNLSNVFFSVWNRSADVVQSEEEERRGEQCGREQLDGVDRIAFVFTTADIIALSRAQLVT